MIRNTIFIGISMLLVTAYTHATTQTCLERAMTQMEMNQCADTGLKEADAELNRVYKKIQQLYRDRPRFIARLKEAQRAWIKSRDADFAMRYPHTDDPSYYGSAFPLCAARYKTQLTLQRVAYLKQWLKGMQEGDLCCGSIKSDYHIQDLLKNKQATQ